MKFVLRDKNTSQYVKQTGIYTASIEEAVDFFCPELAHEFCDKHKLKEHEVLTAEEDY